MMTRTVLVIAAMLSVAANRPAAAQYDYPGEYAQRFDGTSRSGAAGARPNRRIHIDAFRGGVRNDATRTPRTRPLRIK
jgi:hypothetical protein